MNFTEVMTALQSASSFDLYRLDVALRHEMESPERIYQARCAFKEGDRISYFNRRCNALLEAIVVQKNQQSVGIENVIDHQRWTIQYYMINTGRVDVEIHSQKLSKNNLAIGDCVGFNHDGTPITGVVVRLNHKSVSLRTKDHRRWRVSYNLLFKVIDADVIDAFDQKQIDQWSRKELTLRDREDAH